MQDNSRSRFPESVPIIGAKRETARQEFAARKNILAQLALQDERAEIRPRRIQRRRIPRRTRTDDNDVLHCAPPILSAARW